MKINWIVRFKNPIFWLQIVLAIVAPVLAYFGINWQNLTTWPSVWHLIYNALANPVVCISVLISLWNAINDPTTPGFGDSAKALTYIKPNKSGE